MFFFEILYINHLKDFREMIPIFTYKLIRNLQAINILFLINLCTILYRQSNNNFIYFYTQTIEDEYHSTGI